MHADLKAPSRHRGVSPEPGATPPRLRSFPAVSKRQAHTLILGSMPGAESLRVREYYAHPRNAFWPIMGELFGAHPALPYPQRLRRLTDAGIALWDVLAECQRPGSLDAAIDNRTAVANDLPAFLMQHRGITRVFFNGASAERHFQRRFALPATRYTLQRLPSTSPAHASMSYAKKRDAWRVLTAPAKR